ncbi:unnamed protein product [Phaedon cochleariae]|uniref:Uncharacterized protein n=1 Tax=Phaedon cochleariae TaxID=80249 RepID=A0A9N9SIT4_PHACE|nr:unnamed protein product [Phaedon cochleariae]
MYFVILQNCHLESQEQNPSQSTTISAPPPLTPINILKSAGVQTTTLPKLQRIPRPKDSPFQQETHDPGISSIPDLPKLTPRPLQLPDNPAPAEESSTETSTCETGKSLVGSVTSWLPHNAKIVVNLEQTAEEPFEVSRPQYVEFLGGRKFLVIPKHNFMSVSPTVASTANRRNIEDNLDDLETTTVVIDSARLDPNPIPEVKTEPDSSFKPENIESIPDSSHSSEMVEVNRTASEFVVTLGADEKPGEDGKVVDKEPE